MEQTNEITGITVDDLMQLDEDRWFEVVDGQLVETDMAAAGFLHIHVIINIYELLKPHVRKNRLGRVFPDGLTYNLYVDEQGKVYASRIPDVSFVRRENLPVNFDLKRPFPGAPDLAVEVVSPSESADTLRQKIRDYLRYGTEQVWVAYSGEKEVFVYQGKTARDVQIYGETDTFEAPTLFPGLQIKVAEIFTLNTD